VRSEVAKARSTPPEISYNAEAPAGTPIISELTPLERAVGMLLYQFEDDDAVQAKLKSLLGEERLHELATKLEPEAERLRFEFDALGSVTKEEDEEQEGAITETLLESVERILIEEDMRALRQKLYGGHEVDAELGQKLAELKLREQQLRK